jgi:hypothetical protein
MTKARMLIYLRNAGSGAYLNKLLIAGRNRKTEI